VNNELQKMWKEWLWPNLVYCPAICLEGLREPMNSFKKASRVLNPAPSESEADY